MLVIWFWSETCSAFRERSEIESKVTPSRRGCKMLLFFGSSAEQNSFLIGQAAGLLKSNVNKLLST